MNSNSSSYTGNSPQSQTYVQSSFSESHEHKEQNDKQKLKCEKCGCPLLIDQRIENMIISSGKLD